MQRKDSSILGIDLNEREIRAIQVKSRSNQPLIEKVGRAAMPAGAVDQGVIVKPGIVSQAIRSLLDSMEVTTNHVVVGVPGDSVTQRTFTVPPAPDEDLAAIIRGEVEHHQLVKSAFGAHAFIQLSPSCQPAISHTWAEDTEIWIDSRSSKLKPNLVTVFAIEQNTISCLRDAVEGAGLMVEAIEPTQYAMFRSILLSAGPSATFFGIMVGPTNTDIAVVCKSQLIAYRRIETGSRAMTGDTSPTAEYTFAGLNASAYADEPREAVPLEGPLDDLSLEAFSTEVHRTLYYYQREYPDLSQCERVVLAVDDNRLENLAEELSLRLGLSVESVRPFSVSLDSPAANSPYASRSEMVCSAAFGLAMQGQQISRVPRIDLFTEERNAEADVESKRNFRGSILTSAIAIALGVAGWFLYHTQIIQTQTEAKITIAEGTQIRSEIDTKVQERHRQADQYKAFRKKGTPVTEILDAIAGSVGPGAGLTSVFVGQDQIVVIDGESENETSMLSMMNTLNTCPLLLNVKINWFKQMPPEKGSGLNFEFRGTTVTEDRIQQTGGKAN